MLNFDVPRDVTPGLSAIISRNRRARSTLAGSRGEQRGTKRDTKGRARQRRSAGVAKERGRKKTGLVIREEDALSLSSPGECVGVEHPFDALHSGESRRPEGSVGGGLGRDEESGARMVGRRRRRVPWKEVDEDRGRRWRPGGGRWCRTLELFGALKMQRNLSLSGGASA